MEIVVYSSDQKIIDMCVEIFILDGFDDHKKLNDYCSIKFQCGNIEECVTSRSDEIIISPFPIMDNNLLNYYTQKGINIQQKANEKIDSTSLQTGDCIMVPNSCCGVLFVNTGSVDAGLYTALRYLYWYNKHKIGKTYNKVIVPACSQRGSIGRIYTSVISTLQPKFKKRIPGEHFSPNGYNVKK